MALNQIINQKGFKMHENVLTQAFSLCTHKEIIQAQRPAILTGMV